MESLNLWPVSTSHFNSKKDSSESFSSPVSRSSAVGRVEWGRSIDRIFLPRSPFSAERDSKGYSVVFETTVFDTIIHSIWHSSPLEFSPFFSRQWLIRGRRHLRKWDCKGINIGLRGKQIVAEQLRCCIESTPDFVRSRVLKIEVINETTVEFSTWLRSRVTEKSASLYCPLSLLRILAGLTSKWTRLWMARCFRAWNKYYE